MSSAVPGVGDQCTAREVSRARLIVEGDRELYLEPVVVEAAGDRVLLAGKPSYLFRKRPSGASGDLESDGVVFGAVVHADGTAGMVGAPPVDAGNVTAVAASPVGGDRWRVIFAVPDSAHTDGSRVVRSYWHGVYDGARWTEIERLPNPPDLSLQYFNRSRVIERGDTVVWASIVSTSPITASPIIRQRVVVFERVGGAWTHTVPETPYASEVELIHTPRHGFILGVFRHPLNAPSFSGSVEGPQPKTSLHLYTRRSGWSRQREVLVPPTSTVSRTRLDTSGDLVSVTAIASGESATDRPFQLHAITGSVMDQDEPGFVVDPDVLPTFATVVSRAGDFFWLSQHAVPGDSANPGELRLVHRSGDTAKVLWRTPHPYLGWFSAIAYSDSDVLVVGPLLDRTNEVLVSLLIRVRIECAPETRRP